MTRFNNPPAERRMDNGHRLRILGGGKDNPSGLAVVADGALKEARLRLHRAFERLGQADPPGPLARPLLGTYFFLDPVNPNASAVNKVRATMELVKNGLQSDITLKVGPEIESKRGDGDVNGSVTLNRHMSNQSAAKAVLKKWQEGKDWYNLVPDVNGRYALANGAIKISTARLMQDLGVKTLLHEASHKYAGTEDEWYYRDDWPDALVLIRDKLSPVDDTGTLRPEAPKRALRNADSFAWFVYLLGVG